MKISTSVFTRLSCRLFFTSMVLVAVLASCKESPKDVTLATLLHEMTNRKSLAQFPEREYQTKQFSSYDRKAKARDEDGWYANQDRTNFLRSEETANGKEWVMFESDNPGAIVRWWMTFAGEGAWDGTLRVYIDNSTQPVLEGRALDFMSGGLLARRPLSASVSKTTIHKRRGHNLYLPIPYNQCKITYQGDGIKVDEKGNILEESVAIYYNINYREYDDNTAVESITEESLREYLPEINKAQLALLDPYSGIFEKEPSKTMKLRKLAPGESVKLSLDGGRSIAGFVMRLQAVDQSQALRSTVLSFVFDGRKTLQIPVGDFFGTGYEINPYETYYTKVFYDGKMASFWPMPFQESAIIELTNHGNQTVEIRDLEIYTDAWDWNENSLYFGGTWKQFYDKQTGGGENPEDLDFVELQGKGIYVGDLITLYNDAAAWWGEGDEKIYVDGEKFPSHFGTGTEDYYGYAWSRPEFFDHPFIAQPDGSGNLQKGTAINIRFRALDKIPFTEQIDVDMELWHWTKTSMDYAPTTFFYIKPEAEVQHQFNPEHVREKVRFAASTTTEVEPIMKGNSIQGEKMELFRLDRGRMFPRSFEDWDWEEDTHMVWWDAQEGDVAILRFKNSKPVKNATIELQLTRSANYGTVDISVNDNNPFSFDGYAPEIKVTRVELSNIDMRKGWNTVEIKVTGKNTKSKNFVFGIDYLKIKK